MFAIVDWTHREVWQDMRFPSFQDAWDHIYQHFAVDDPDEEKYGDVYALPVVDGKILGFNDPWPEGLDLD